MVFFFTSVTPAGTFTLYMGRDKFENEQLIAHGWPEDLWSKHHTALHTHLTLAATLSLHVFLSLTLCSPNAVTLPPTDLSLPLLLRIRRFHVDDLSSAHVYVRLPTGMTAQTIPKGLSHIPSLLLSLSPALRIPPHSLPSSPPPLSPPPHPPLHPVFRAAGGLRAAGEGQQHRG